MILKKNFICFFITLVIFKSVLFSQNAFNDSVTIIKYISQSEDYQQTNPDSAIIAAAAAYELAHKTQNTYLIAKATINLGVAYQGTANYKKSTQYFIEGIAIAEKVNNKKIICQAYNSFANLFANQRQFAQASDYYKKAIDIAKEIKDTLKTAVILTNLSNLIYNESYVSNNYKPANEAYSESLKWAKLSKDTAIQITALSNWGMSLSDEQEYGMALEMLNQALLLAKKTNNVSDLVFIYHYTGRTYSFMNQHERAIEQFMESLLLAKKLNDLEYETENYYYLAISNYALKNYKQAFDFFEIHKNLNDTLSNKEITNELNAFKVKFDTEKKQKEIEILTVNANKDKLVKIGLMVGAFLLLVLAFLMFNRYRLKAKTNKLLEEQNLIISEKNKDISDSINYAKKIQEAIFPNHADIEKVFPEYFILSLPKDVVSGDFYWFTQSNNLKIFVVADCTGHGVPGAFMSMIGNTLLNQIVVERKILRPDLILNELRKEIIKSLKQGEDSKSRDGMDLSLICLNSETAVLEVACANNPVWILKQDGALLEVKPDKQPIGYVSAASQDFSLNSIQLQKGDIIYQFTDGYADQFGGDKGKKFKYNQLKELLVKMNDAEMAHQHTRLKTCFENWKGNLVQIDDVLVTGIKI